MLRNSSVALRPVNRKPKITPEVFKGLLIFLSQSLTEFDEILPRDWQLVCSLRGLIVSSNLWRSEVVLVSKCWIAANSVVVLNSSFRGQAIVIPAHGVVDVEAVHSLVAGYYIGVRVAKNVTHVQ